jgi:glycosyltransferase involved in cell wall biosynthesis
LAPPREAPFDRRPLRAVFVGRLDRKKGADLLLSALPAAPDWSATIVGDGAERSTLEPQVVALGLTGRVEFTGAVAHDQVPRILAEADALVCPSRTVPGWAEQFGHVLAWAMAAGAPIVASRCGAIPEVVDDAGLLIDENEVAALSAALSRLTAPDLRRKLAAAGRARAAAVFTDEAVARRLEQALVMTLERSDVDVGL